MKLLSLPPIQSQPTQKWQDNQDVPGNKVPCLGYKDSEFRSSKCNMMRLENICKKIDGRLGSPLHFVLNCNSLE
nr:14053_t:CDS:2 [Entrophospora candida]